MANKASFWQYLKTAFTWHWNLLAVGAGSALAFLSGRPDVVLPLLGAVEVAYLGLLSTNPRFRKSVDAKVLSQRGDNSKDKQLRKILTAISPRDQRRFEHLRTRCATLQKLGRQFHGRGEEEEADSQLTDMHLASLDRLLWMFLKLLYSKDALERYLVNTDRKALAAEISETEKDLERARAGDRVNLVRSLEDKLNTMRTRLKNYDAASDNHELIEVELERIEQKVTAVSEMSLSTTDPGSLSAQVDGITESIAVTADAIHSLDMVPDFQEDDAPSLLSQETS